MQDLKFRQVHLDFHTSEAVPEIGSKFDRKQFQNALKVGNIDSITCFAKCHHGWMYYDSKVSPKHPNLSFDLLREQFEACKSIDVNVPIYVSAGFDEYAAHEHPDWKIDFVEEKLRDMVSPIKAQWKRLCFNSPYVEYLCKQLQEVVKEFPDCDGIFLDIIFQFDCGCKYCLKWMEDNGLDATIAKDRKKCVNFALHRYYELSTNAIRSINPDMPIFHNSGHIQRGNRDIFKFISHLEIESLPTGGWGYDNFPISAKYCKNLPFDFLGMTGKFHTTWGEFGGYKHPNALQYECSAMIAFGAKCSIGDQLHPSGEMNMSTYRLIGKSYEYIKKCESFCKNIENVAEIALLSAQSVIEGGRHAGKDNDIGAARILLEGHFLFDVIDTEMNFSKYKLLILPDVICVNDVLKERLDDYLSNGGKLILTGQSGIEDGQFIFDIGADYFGPSPYCPDYILPDEQIRPDFIEDPVVMYMCSQRIKATQGKSLGNIYDPYFNRSYNHFCSHQHTPNKPEVSGFDCGVVHGNILYLAHPIFSLYRGVGAIFYKDYAIKVINNFMGKSKIQTNLPSTSRISLMHQESECRYVLHLLHANTVNRGGPMKLEGGTKTGESRSVEIIEGLTDLYNTKIDLVTKNPVKKVVLEPQNREIGFEFIDNRLCFSIDKFNCHQMVLIYY